MERGSVATFGLRLTAYGLRLLDSCRQPAVGIIEPKNPRLAAAHLPADLSENRSGHVRRGALRLHADRAGFDRERDVDRSRSTDLLEKAFLLAEVELLAQQDLIVDGDHDVALRDRRLEEQSQCRRAG